MVDSSVWIDFFNGRLTLQAEVLRDHMLGQSKVLVGDLILLETLQGFRHERDFRRAKDILETFPIKTLGGGEMALLTAQHYRQLRKRGVTVRKSVDVLIGTYCIAYGIPLLYSDRDFDPLVEHLGLESAVRLH